MNHAYKGFQKIEQTSIQTKNSSWKIFPLMETFAKRFFAIGLSLAGNMSMSQTPISIPLHELKSSNPRKLSPIIPGSDISIPSVAVFSNQKTVYSTATVLQQESLSATAIRWQSVSSFLYKNFQIAPGLESVIEAQKRLVDTYTGHRVRNANRDLIANHTYILAENEQVAEILSAQYKKVAKERREKENIIHTSEWEKNVKKEIKAQKTTKSQVTKKSKIQKFVGSTLSCDEFIQAVSPKFHYDSYTFSISAGESNHTFYISNEVKGKKLWIKEDDHCFGKYQFSRKTLRFFGVITQEQLISFLKNPEQQEDIMKQFVYGNVTFIKNSPVLVSILDSGVELHQMLAAMHHMGAGWVMRVAKKSINTVNPSYTFFQELWKSKDWLDTNTRSYIEAASKKYIASVKVETTKKTRTGVSTARNNIIPFTPLSQQNEQAIERLKSTSWIAKDVKDKLVSTLQKYDINESITATMEKATAEWESTGHIQSLQTLAKLHELKKSEDSVRNRLDVMELFGDDNDDMSIAEQLRVA